LQKILSQLEFEHRLPDFSGRASYSIRLPRHVIIFITITNVKKEGECLEKSTCNKQQTM